MKKRIITLCMAVMLLAVFAVSSFAVMYNDHDLPDIRPYTESSDNFIYLTNGQPYLYTIVDGFTVANAEVVNNKTRVYLKFTNGLKLYNIVDGTWEFNSVYDSDANYPLTLDNFIWSSFDIVYDGITYVEASSVYYPPDTVDSADFNDVSTQLTGQINVQHTVSVIALAVTACVGLAFMWWGVRKAIAAIMAAFRKGKVNL